MQKLRFCYETIEFGDVDIHVRSLRDTQEFHDEGGVAEALGISSALWPLFGVLWDSSRALANLMFEYDIDDKRILEIGCGLGLASLVLNHRHADITATDYHPEVGNFLKVNTALNGDADIPFERAGWEDEGDSLGEFDLIIASDVLYERGHDELLASFIERHARPTCEILVIDPKRGQANRFGRQMESRGFTYTKQPAPSGSRPDEPYKGLILRLLR